MAQRNFQFDEDYLVDDEQVSTYNNVYAVHQPLEVEPEPQRKPMSSYQSKDNPENLVITRPFRRRFKGITRLEKVFLFFILVTAIAMMVATVTIRTEMNETMNNNVEVDAKNTKTQEKINELKQESNELLKRDRVEKIAKEKGLKVNDNNVKKVDKP